MIAPSHAWLVLPRNEDCSPSRHHPGIAVWSHRNRRTSGNLPTLCTADDTCWLEPLPFKTDIILSALWKAFHFVPQPFSSRLPVSPPDFKLHDYPPDTHSAPPDHTTDTSACDRNHQTLSYFGRVTATTTADILKDRGMSHPGLCSPNTRRPKIPRPALSALCNDVTKPECWLPYPPSESDRGLE